MATFIIILILCGITAAVTFTATRSLYTNRFVDWYRESIAGMPVMTSAQIDFADEKSDEMAEVLLEKYERLFKINPRTVPKNVIDLACGYEGDHFSSCIYDLFRAARWLGYDLTLTKRPLPPPPVFKHRPTPRELKQEFVECWDADARVSEMED
jgi:hypothetical protein